MRPWSDNPFAGYDSFGALDPRRAVFAPDHDPNPSGLLQMSSCISCDTGSATPGTHHLRGPHLGSLFRASPSLDHRVLCCSLRSSFRRCGGTVLNRPKRRAGCIGVPHPIVARAAARHDISSRHSTACASCHTLVVGSGPGSCLRRYGSSGRVKRCEGSLRRGRIGRANLVFGDHGREGLRHRRLRCDGTVCFKCSAKSIRQLFGEPVLCVGGTHLSSTTASPKAKS